ncbi:Type I restriction enzyme R protein N terminal domain protein [Cyanobium sp. PCC 7001]|uniref:type I restriction endonuclease n=1 Tax=Cyanobium sp. PCC 7001 TaxID=180281 RepID=UPI0001804F4E|nr:type I restriction endonuclease [Cyanobium sp. PCC 7001]EDY37288.1 Type I restriction enzyme R protein N terminal domain protein [Cyanobium sp. PCC 7001]
MDLIDQLQALAARAEKTAESLTNEDATKMALIAPFIQALGYDIFNPMEVKPEFSADLPGVNKKDERVDYAVLENGEPKILVEAKSYGTDLRQAEMGQLSRYFHATNARIGILSNGRIFQFFSDLDDKNKMDSKPFAEIDLFDLQSAPLDQIKQLSKSMFDIDTLLQSAERLKYLRGVKEQIRDELTDPSEWLVKEMARRVHSAERITTQTLEKFKPIVADAIKLYINERINKRLEEAMKAPEVVTAPAPEEVSRPDADAIVTTSDEMEGLYIVRAICASEIDPNRLSEKDTKAYCNVLLDQNSWKAIVRLHFNGGQKKIEIFDDAEPKLVQVDTPSEIYRHADRVRAALRKKLA